MTNNWKCMFINNKGYNNGSHSNSEITLTITTPTKQNTYIYK